MKISGRPALVTIAPSLAGMAVFVGIVVVAWATSPSDRLPNDDWRVILILAVGVPAGLVGLFVTLVLFRREIRQQLGEFTARFGDDLIGAVTAVHYPRYRGGAIATGVGGFFALTRTGITFQTHPGPFNDSDVRISFDEMRKAAPCPIGVGHGFRVERTDGSTEYFQISPSFGERSARAAERIEEWRRYRLSPDRRPEPEASSWTDR